MKPTVVIIRQPSAKTEEHLWCQVCGGIMDVVWMTSTQLSIRCSSCGNEELHGALTDQHGQPLNSLAALVRELSLTDLLPPDNRDVLPFDDLQ